MNAPQPGRVGVRLAGTGVAVPQRVLTNEDLAKIVQTNDEWITQRTGIRERRVVQDGVQTRDLAREAMDQCLRDANVQPGELDMLICASMTPEMTCPSTAARVVAELGATPAGAMDITAACSGFVYGLNLAAAGIHSGLYRTVAVVGAEVLSRILDWEDRRTCILFGDGAGAAILTADEDPQLGCLVQTTHSDGRGWQELYVPQRESDLPEDRNGFSGKLGTMQMNGREVYRFAVSTFHRCVQQTLQKAGLQSSDLAMIVAHQSNRRILESAREKLKLPEDKLYINIDHYGNTSAASVPICLHELRQQGRIASGDLVLFIAMGGGLTWASSLWRV